MGEEGWDSQSDESGLKVLLQEDTFLRLGPVDVLLGRLDDRRTAIRDEAEEVEQCSNYLVRTWSA